MSHYFEDPLVSSEPTLINATLRGRSVQLHTDRGVFSKDALDRGTAVLLTTLPPPPDRGDLLDLGCGYGPVAAAMGFEAPHAIVWAIDVNARARRLCIQNCDNLGLSNVKVRAPEEVPPEILFAAIWSNPPIRIGKAAVHELLTRWLNRLEPYATANLVVQRNLGSDSLQAWLTASGWLTTRLTSRNAFRVLEVHSRQPSLDATSTGFPGGDPR